MVELLFSLNRDSSIPMYTQVYTYIRSQILAGTIPQNAKLPSIRQLASQLNVSRNTTQLAYEQLQAEGYIRSEYKRGYYVETLLTDEIFSYESHRTHSPASLQNAANDVIDFKLGTVDEEHFPLKTWRRLANRVMKESSIYAYGEKQGELSLREQLAHYLFQSRGVHATASQIVIGAGTKQLLLLLSLLLKKDYPSIAMEDPGYDVARTFFEHMSFAVTPISVTTSGLQIDALRASQEKLLYVTPTHHYPSGITMSVKQRMQLLHYISNVNGYIIEDDYDSEFRYIHQPIPSLHSMDHNERVIYMGTCSKALLPSLRISYLVLPPSLLTAYHAYLAVFEQTASTIHQETLALFMRDGFWYAHLRKMRALYKRKMHTLVAALTRSFQQDLTMKGEHSGLFVVIEVKRAIREELLIEAARQHGVIVYPCSRYYAEKQPLFPQVQLGFGNLSEAHIEEGVRKLCNAWRPLLESNE
ncbi:aminotransferase, MocR-like protein [Fictibacillus macauensis ZFHKF-1]|uniref:Aminotransferase, MocR-like protein n=1 Tax=Fictibacillus macauensis ZFHKF-1 TaxID=1196324 RepID=I8AGR3_9BACL|nr:PLP-dependent aminotransferase family protein [Fictibacillus macauensis]EIT84872.1 aminotransferase, MocR-like protein [Fictibacillus macauensis ZFHKF-1]